MANRMNWDRARWETHHKRWGSTVLSPSKKKGKKSKSVYGDNWGVRVQFPEGEKEYTYRSLESAAKALRHSTFEVKHAIEESRGRKRIRQGSLSGYQLSWWKKS
jgi:hypothetical protein